MLSPTELIRSIISAFLCWSSVKSLEKTSERENVKTNKPEAIVMPAVQFAKTENVNIVARRCSAVGNFAPPRRIDPRILTVTNTTSRIAIRNSPGTVKKLSARKYGIAMLLKIKNRLG